MKIANQTIKWIGANAYGNGMREAVYKILFKVYGCDYGAVNEPEVDEESREYEVLRDSLEHVKFSIQSLDEFFDDNCEEITDILEEAQSNIAQFLDLLDEMISKSDPENEWVYVSWF